MNKKEIIDLVDSMGFKLDYDKYDEKEYPGDSINLRYMRFISKDEDLHEKDLTWIWYKTHTDESNINRGLYIQSRFTRKKEIQDFLKY